MIKKKGNKYIVIDLKGNESQKSYSTKQSALSYFFSKIIHPILFDQIYELRLSGKPNPLSEITFSLKNFDVDIREKVKSGELARAYLQPPTRVRVIDYNLPRRKTNKTYFQLLAPALHEFAPLSFIYVNDKSFIATNGQILLDVPNRIGAKKGLYDSKGSLVNMKDFAPEMTIDEYYPKYQEVFEPFEKEKVKLGEFQLTPELVGELKALKVINTYLSKMLSPVTSYDTNARIIDIWLFNKQYRLILDSVATLLEIMFNFLVEKITVFKPERDEDEMEAIKWWGDNLLFEGNNGIRGIIHYSGTHHKPNSDTEENMYYLIGGEE